jgi:fatty acid elongase 3
MAPLADFLVAHNPFPAMPHYLTTFTPGLTPLSTLNSTVATLALYLVLIFGIQGFMKNREPMKLTLLFQAHNAFLSAGSLVLLVLMLEEMLPILWKRGVFDAMCADDSWTTVIFVFIFIWTMTIYT